jgi:hypothetical protein
MGFLPFAIRHVKETSKQQSRFDFEPPKVVEAKSIKWLPKKTDPAANYSCL